MEERLIKNINFNGLTLYVGSYENISICITNICKLTPDTFIFAHINVYNYFQLKKYFERDNELNDNCYLFFDGIGMSIGNYLVTKKWISGINGTDLFPILMKYLNNMNMAIYLLGSKEDVVKKASEKIKERFPSVKINGYSNGYFSSEDEQNVVATIKKSCSDLLIIGMGFPLQEKFAFRNKESLGVKCIWTVGGLFDFISESKPRAPKILRRLKFEWLFRFTLEPRRMFFRYTIVLIWFFFHVIKLNATKLIKP